MFVVEGAKVPGLKDLLGAGNADINNAFAELRCGTLNGIVPVMSKHGGLVAHKKQTDPGVAACAILKADWALGTEKSRARLKFHILCSLVRRFNASTVLG